MKAVSTFTSKGPYIKDGGSCLVNDQFLSGQIIIPLTAVRLVG